MAVLATYWERNVCLNRTICKLYVTNLTNMSNFHQLEVVGHGSDTQLQGGENLIYQI